MATSSAYVVWLLSAILCLAQGTGEVPIAASDILVVSHAGQQSKDTQTMMEGIYLGIEKSANKDLADQLVQNWDLKALYLEMDKGELFEGEVDFVSSWIKNHVEVLKPKVVVSVGPAASLVDDMFAALSTEFLPQWHLKCLQSACPTQASGVVPKETCVYFEPAASRVLRTIGNMKPAVKKILVLSDGSAFAGTLVAGFQALPDSTLKLYCGGTGKIRIPCTIQTVMVKTAQDVDDAVAKAVLSAGGPDDLFVVLPSIDKMSSSATEISMELLPHLVGEMVPEELLPMGALMAIHAHPGGSGEDCSYIISQKMSIGNVDPYSVETSDSTGIRINAARAANVAGLNYLTGELSDDGRNKWHPVQIIWPEEAGVVSMPKPKVLIVNSYMWGWEFTRDEHEGFLYALQGAGWAFQCRREIQACSGSLDIRTIYLWTKMYMKTDALKQLQADYAKEYIKRWKPDVTYTTDDHAMKHLVIQCMEPLKDGPNPEYPACSSAQFISNGINSVPLRDYANKCRQYQDVAGERTCAGESFFVESDTSNRDACSSCNVGNEPICIDCTDLYYGRRPVNITVQLELGDYALELEVIKTLRPNATRLALIADHSGVSNWLLDQFQRAYKVELEPRGTNHGITVDFAEVNRVDNVSHFKDVVTSYQNRPEYFLYIVQVNLIMPRDAAAKDEVWTWLLANNKLGEMVPYAYFSSNRGFLAGGMVRAFSLGRACGSYADVILRGEAHAAELPILNTRMTKLYLNTKRAEQLSNSGIVSIPQYLLGQASQVFDLCGPGKYRFENRCASCPGGTIKPGYGDSQELCIACDVGEFSPGENAMCKKCEPGKFSATRSATACSDCPPGEYAPGVGASSCLLCPVGEYNVDPGQSQCRQCNRGHSAKELWTTMRSVWVQDELVWVLTEGSQNASSCGCAEGAQLWQGECHLCSEGLICSGMSEAGGPNIRVEEGFAWDHEASVYRCYGNTDRCPGGLPGVCASGRDPDSIACTQCEIGKTPGENGTCVECAGSDQATFFFIGAVAFVCIAILYRAVYKYSRVSQHLGVTLMIPTFCQTFYVLQLYSVVAQLSIEWTEPIASTLRFMQVFVLDLAVLRPGCIATFGPVGMYFLRICLMLSLFGAMAIVHVAAVLIRREGRLRDANRTLIASLGSLFQLLHVSVVSTVLLPLRCVRHPNGQWTLSESSSVVCWEGGEHGVMLSIGLVTAIIPVAYYIKCFSIVRRIQRKMRNGDANFVTTFSDLFANYKPEAFWFVLVVLCGNAILAAVPALPNPLNQVAIMQIVMIFSLSLVLYTRPYRMIILNVLHTFLYITVIILVSLSLCFVRAEDLSIVSEVCTAVVGISLVALPLALAYVAMRMLRSNSKPFDFFLCHHKVGAGSFARALKMQLAEQNGPSQRSFRAFVDSDDLRDLGKLFSYVGAETKTHVLLLSADVLRRPWCIGELVTAHLNEVKTIVVLYPDATLPDEDFVENYEDRVDISCLAEHGINYEMVQAMLRWLLTLPCIQLPENVNEEVLCRLSYELASSMESPATKLKVIEPPVPSKVANGKVMIVADHSNSEAMATAISLRKLLAAGVLEDPTLAPQILQQGQVLHADVKDVILVCSNGVFLQPHVLKSLVVADACKAFVLPLLADDTFRFPSKNFLKELRGFLGQLMDKDHNPDLVIAIVENVFKQIACVFNTAHYSSTEAVLQAKALEIAARIRSPPSRGRSGSSTRSSIQSVGYNSKALL